MSPAKTTTERVANSKRRKRESGLVEVRSLWAHPDDVRAIRSYAHALYEARITVQASQALAPSPAK